MSWKSELRLSDLDPGASIEATCLRCGLTRVRPASELQARPQCLALHLDELEKRLICPDRTCRGRMRLAIEHQHRVEGFVGGMA